MACALMRHGNALPDDPDRPKPAENPAVERVRAATVNEKTIADFARVVEQNGDTRT